MSRDFRVGQFFTLVSVAIEGLFPAIAHAATGILPPLWFLAVCQLGASLMYALIITIRGWRPSILQREAIKNAIGVTICIVVIPYGLIFLGTRLSTGINTSLLLSLEVPYTALVSWLFFRESLTPWAMLGVAFAIGGALAIFGQAPHGAVGEILIISAVITLPFGNRFAKRALHTLRGEELLFIRSFLAGLIILPVSFLLETPPPWPLPSGAITWMLLYIAILVTGKMFWYAGMKHLRVVDAVSLLSILPAFSLIFTMLILGEQPTRIQMVGFLLSFIGVVLITNIRLRKTAV